MIAIKIPPDKIFEMSAHLAGNETAFPRWILKYRITVILVKLWQ